MANLMTNQSELPRTALVLPGGGARGAFQVGVLKALAEILPKSSPNPFPIISGTSAGAVNAVVLASKAERYRSAIAELEQVWAHFRCHQVYKTDHLTMIKSSLHWLFSFMLGGWLVGTPKALLNNAPLRELLSRNVHFPRIQQAIDSGYLEAVAITAAGYESSRSKSFFEGAPNLRNWDRTRRLGARTDLNLDHVMASIAVPMIFPPQIIGNEYFGDGAMRQATPLSPAVHLGADRILVIGIRDETGGKEPTKLGPYPSFGQIAGYMLDTLFMDGLYSDLERITRINELIDSVPESQRSGTIAKVRPIDTMLVVPSEDLREIAVRHRQELPVAIRALLRGIGGKGSGESRLLSFLLFEKAYTRELIALGYRDGMNVKDELLDFVSGAEVPRLFAPDWIQRDLSSFHSDDA
jgi:NTE family protein